MAQSEKMSTKLIVIVLVGIAFIAGFFVARARYKPQISTLSTMVIERDDKISFLNNLKNRLTLRGGELVKIKDGEMMTVEEDVLLSDGTKVTVEGVVVRPDGEKEKLDEGGSIFMDGMIVSPEKIKEMQEK